MMTYCVLCEVRTNLEIFNCFLVLKVVRNARKLFIFQDLKLHTIVSDEGYTQEFLVIKFF
jgi:hypothetical protein